MRRMSCLMMRLRMWIHTPQAPRKALLSKCSAAAGQASGQIQPRTAPSKQSSSFDGT